MKSPESKPPRLTRLKITDDRGFEKVVLIDKDVFPIGREEPGGLALPDEDPGAMAASHALIIRDGDTYVLKDKSGSCGTRVNGRPIRSVVLKHGDQIALGSSRLRIHFLVEGTRATDFEESRVRLLLEALCDVHSAPDATEVCTRAVACIVGLAGCAWAAVSLRPSPGAPLEIVAALDRTGSLPGGASAIAQHVAGTERSYFHPARLCVPIMGTVTGEKGPGPVGLIGVIDSGPRDWTPYRAADMERLESLAAHVGIALTNARRLQAITSGELQKAAAG